MNYLWKPIRIFFGIVLLIIGAIGGLIPIFQGWVFGIIGLWLLSIDIPFIRKYFIRIREWLEEKESVQRWIMWVERKFNIKISEKKEPSSRPSDDTN
jgi:hypothetical protein